MRSSETSYFLAFCVEQYKHAHGMSGEEAMQRLDRYGVLDYLAKNYDVIHTQGADWIVADMDEYINNRKS